MKIKWKKLKKKTLK